MSHADSTRLKPPIMYRSTSLAGLAALAAALWLASPPAARAQLGTIFSDPAPRPPGSIPDNGAQPDDEEDVPDLPEGGRLLPAPNRLPPGQGAPPPGAYQTQPLPPPPGASVAPPAAPAQPGVAAVPRGNQNQPAPASQHHQPPQSAPPTPATLQPGDEVVTEPPAQKIVNKKAVFSGLDKITGRITTFDEAIGETVQFGALRVKTDACYTRPATEAANTDAFVEVDEITLQGEVKRIFSGWMFAASPGLHAVEHPIYDIWLTDCKDPETTVVAGEPAASQTAAPKPAPAAQRRPPPARRRAPAPSRGPEPLSPIQE
jgi:hypothetical protein